MILYLKTLVLHDTRAAAGCSTSALVTAVLLVATSHAQTAFDLICIAASNAATSRPIIHGCKVTASNLLVVTAGTGMQQQQQQHQQGQQAFASTQHAMQAPSSQAPKANPSAQAGQAPFPLHHQSANRFAGHLPSTGTPTSAAAAPAAEQAPTASQIASPTPSGMTQQPQSIRVKGPSLGFPAGQPANSRNSSTLQLSAYDMQQPMHNTNPGMGSLAVAQPEQPRAQPTQSSSATAVAPANTAAGVGQVAPRSVAAEMLNKD